MALNYGQQLVLRVELETDPKNLGYTDLVDGVPVDKDTNECADLLNTVGLSSEKISNTTASVNDIKLAIDPDELPNIHYNKMDYLWRLIGNGSVDISQGSGIKNLIAKVFTQVDAPITRAALDDLKEKDATRGEILFGINIVITHTDVGRARQVV